MTPLPRNNSSKVQKVPSDGWSMGRGRSREAAQGSARAGPFDRSGGPRTPGSAPGAAGGRRPAPWGRGRSGWAAAHGCAGRWPVCCGPSPGVVLFRGCGAGGLGQLGCLRLSRRPPIDPEFPTYVATVALTTRHLQSIPRNPHAMESAPRDCGDARTECCVRVWCWIERPLGRDWVCMWHGACIRGSGGAGENELHCRGEKGKP